MRRQKTRSGRIARHSAGKTAARTLVGARGDYGLVRSASTGHVGTIRSGMGLTQEELGRVTGFSTRAIAGWESGRKVSDSARQKLAETERFRAALAGIIPPKEVGNWLRAPNPAFENQTPLQVIERGELDRLWRMIFQVESNASG